MSIDWDKDQTLGKGEHAYYRLSQRYCPEPAIEEWRWFIDYQAIRGPYDPNGTFTTIGSCKIKEEAIAACEENAQFDKEHL